ncbi:MAG TPA: DsbA family oxidoreductase [Acidimicrobiales bacterium]|nr:DsbA family oxidoreductase [Acidimicrobiales bacterium]
MGKRRFEAALDHFEHGDEVNVHWRAFELDPSAPRVSDGDSASHLAEKYGMTKTDATAAQERLAATAALDGLEFHFEKTKRGNTFDAHRLLHYAHEVGVQDALKERLFGAYFTDGDAIGDRATLVRLGEEVGLDPSKSAEILESDRYGREVRADELEARELGISGVPFFVIDRHFGIAGAQSPDAILQVLNEAWAKEHPVVVGTHDSQSICEGDNCTI